MQTILNNPILSTLATVLVAALVYLWKGLGTYLEARTPQAIHDLLTQVIPPLVEATEKTQAYSTGKQKLDFVFAQLDKIAKSYGVQFPDAAARALIEQHVLSLPHTGMAAAFSPVKNTVTSNTTNPSLNPAL